MQIARDGNWINMSKRTIKKSHMLMASSAHVVQGSLDSVQLEKVCVDIIIQARSGPLDAGGHVVVDNVLTISRRSPGSTDHSSNTNRKHLLPGSLNHCLLATERHTIEGDDAMVRAM